MAGVHPQVLVIPNGVNAVFNPKGLFSPSEYSLLELALHQHSSIDGSFAELTLQRDDTVSAESSSQLGRYQRYMYRLTQ